MQQWMRYCSLIVSGQGDALDLSKLRISFEIRKTENETPNQAQIKIYNLAQETENQIINEFTRVTLQAGYQDHYGVIFDGEITQSKRGREVGTDTYVMISASDGDQAYNSAIVNVTLSAGSSQSDHIAVASKAMGVGVGHIDTAGQKLPRGKVMYGHAKDVLRTSAYSNDQDWSIQDGQLQVLGKISLLPNQAVVLNSQSGLIGGAEQSTKGINAKALLNPMLKIGAHVIINEADVALAKIQLKKADTSKNPPVDGTDTDKLALVAKDGSYKIIGASFVGDTYGTDWYSEIVCLDVDATIKKVAKGKKKSKKKKAIV
jgi:hypothetical protein